MVHSLLDKLSPKPSQDTMIPHNAQVEEARTKLFAFQLSLHSPSRDETLSPRADSQSSSAEESSQDEEEEYEMEDEDSSDKKKNCRVNFACTECRKAHKGCSGGRPCERCVKMGLQDKCRSSVRKKRILTKKYWHHFLVQQLSKTSPTVDGLGNSQQQQAHPPTAIISPRQASPRMLYTHNTSNSTPFHFEPVNTNSSFVPYPQHSSQIPQQPVMMPYYPTYQQQQPVMTHTYYENFAQPMPSVCHTSSPYGSVSTSMMVSPRGGDVDQVQPMKISPRYHTIQQPQTILPSISNLIETIDSQSAVNLVIPHASSEDSMRISPRSNEKLSLKSILN